MRASYGPFCQPLGVRAACLPALAQGRSVGPCSVEAPASAGAGCAGRRRGMLRVAARAITTTASISMSATTTPGASPSGPPAASATTLPARPVPMAMPSVFASWADAVAAPSAPDGRGLDHRQCQRRVGEAHPQPATAQAAAASQVGSAAVSGTPASRSMPTPIRTRPARSPTVAIGALPGAPAAMSRPPRSTPRRSAPARRRPCPRCEPTRPRAGRTPPPRRRRR